MVEGQRLGLMELRLQLLEQVSRLTLHSPAKTYARALNAFNLASSLAVRLSSLKLNAKQTTLTRTPYTVHGRDSVICARMNASAFLLMKREKYNDPTKRATTALTAKPNRAQPHGLGALFSSFFDGVACDDALSGDEVPNPSAVSNLVASDTAASGDVNFPELDDSFAAASGKLLSASAESSGDSAVIHITANADPSTPTFVATRRGFEPMPPEAYQPPIREDTKTRSTKREAPRLSGGSESIRSFASLRRRVTPWGNWSLLLRCMASRVTMLYSLPVYFGLGIELCSYPITDQRL